MSVESGLDRAFLDSWSAPFGRCAGVEALAGDVGLRRYYRISLEDGGSLLLATYPEALEAAYERFERTTELLAEIAVRVPQILARDRGRRWMLLEDLGPRTVFDLEPRWPRLEAYYRDGLAAAQRIAGLPREVVADLSEPLGRMLLERELAQTLEVFLEPSGLLTAAPQRRRVERAFADLCAALAADEVAPCHRDFMVRNLVPLEGGRVAVLDHQDLRLGPAAYDAASLLNDSFFLPEAEALLGEQAGAAAYHRAAAQRTLKAVGTYAAFARRGHRRHLPLIRPTLERACDHLAALPDSAALAAEIRGPWSLAAGSVC